LLGPAVKDKLRLAVINLVTSFILALVLELILFGALEHPRLIPGFLEEPFREYYRGNDRSIIQVTECGRYDSALFYTLNPGSCWFKNREFRVENRINSAGVRDDESSLQFPRAIVLGDSYAMGWGVQQDESFPQILEQGLHWKVLNAGISSYGTARELILLKRFTLDSMTHLFIQYHANDYEENIRFIKGNFELPIRSKHSYDSLRNTVGRRDQYFLFKHLYGISKAIAKGILRKQDSKQSDPDEAQSFLQVVRQADIRPDIPIIVFKVDDYNKLNDQFLDSIDSLLQTREFENLNIKTLRLSDDLRKEDYFILDDHINKSGHEKIAAKIRKQILSVSP
jgi:hypothetical protein